MKLWCGFVLVLLSAGASSGARGQGAVLFSPHFGASMFPTPDAVWEVGMSFDRFTQHAQDADYTDSTRRFPRPGRNVPEYLLARTDGYNMAHVSRSVPIRRWSSLVRLTLHGGWIGEQPTKFLQNDFRHRDLNIGFIPVESTAESEIGTHLEGGVSAAIHHWIDSRLGQAGSAGFATPLFAGAGIAASTIYHEGFIEFGIRRRRIIRGTTELFALSAMARKGLFVRESAWRGNSRPYKSDVLANTYDIVQASVALPVGSWFQRATFVPTIELGYSRTSGLFMGYETPAAADSGRLHGKLPRRIPEKFMTIGFQWAEGDVAFETYNDSPNNKDKGPSYGARLYVRWRNLFWDR